MTRTRFVATLVLALSGASWAAESPSALFETANAAYEQGDFTRARESYEKIIQDGLGSSALYFNLGNAYYRLGRLGFARLWYERATLLDPADADVRHNIGLIENQLRQDGEGSAPASRWAPLAPCIFWTLLAVNAAFFTVLIIGLTADREWIWWGRWILGIVLVALLLWAALARSQEGVNYGVVVEARGEVRTGPGPDHRVAFVAPEAHKVVLLETRTEWTEIGLPERGLKGWVKKEAVAPIAF